MKEYQHVPRSKEHKLGLREPHIVRPKEFVGRKDSARPPAPQNNPEVGVGGEFRVGNGPDGINVQQ